MGNGDDCEGRGEMNRECYDALIEHVQSTIATRGVNSTMYSLLGDPFEAGWDAAMEHMAFRKETLESMGFELSKDKPVDPSAANAWAHDPTHPNHKRKALGLDMIDISRPCKVPVCRHDSSVRKYGDGGNCLTCTLCNGWEPTDERITYDEKEIQFLNRAKQKGKENGS